MNLESKKVFESKVVPGVTVTLRCLNQRQRAKRDLAIATERFQFNDAYAHLRTLIEEWKDKESDRPPEVTAEINELDFKIGLLLDACIKPATIKASLVKIDGMTLDGKPYTAESFVESCTNDALVNEIWIEAEKTSGLSSEQSEGFSSPSPSQEAAAGVTKNTDAPNASTGVTIETAIAASTSPSA